jgi:hypothetical protein
LCIGPSVQEFNGSKNSDNLDPVESKFCPQILPIYRRNRMNSAGFQNPYPTKSAAFRRNSANLFTLTGPMGCVLGIVSYYTNYETVGECRLQYTGMNDE